VLIRGRFVDFREIRNFGFLSADILVSQQQQIRYSIQQFLSKLNTEHFSPEFLQNPDSFFKAIEAESRQQKDVEEKYNQNIPFVHKTGELLYYIPKRMQFECTYRCVIRIAYLRELLFKNWQKDEYDVEKSIRIGEEMNVEIVNVYDPEPFKIKPLNRSGRQILDKEDYTEWLFDVTPEYEGTYSLLLRITAIEIKDGREVAKEMVVEEFVVVNTKKAPKPKIKLQKIEQKFEISTSKVKISESELDSTQFILNPDQKTSTTKSKTSESEKNLSSNSITNTIKNIFGGILGVFVLILSFLFVGRKN